MSQRYYNVVIFGAGASADAGIPLLSCFIERMNDLAVRGKVKGEPISEEQLNTLRAAKEIWHQLDGYHSRATFDQFNLEDVLSLLAFEALDDKNGAVAAFQTMTKAISIVIELTCSVKHDDGTPSEPYILEETSQSTYQRFWHALFSNGLYTNQPALITFNYDLTLERSLWQYCHMSECIGSNIRSKVVSLQYFTNQRKDITISVIGHDYKTAHSPKYRMGTKPVISCNSTPHYQIPYLKMHGSLNWPSETAPNDEELPHPSVALDNPLVLPPVFNKLNTNVVNSIWGRGLEFLRQARNVVIIGYSMPETDIYVRHFLRAAFGAAKDLDKITVFDPVLFKDDDVAERMRKRYALCFSTEFQQRIQFRPSPMKYGPPGSFRHFVEMLQKVEHFSQLFFIE